MEHATFTPLVMAATRGLANEANVFYKILPNGITPTALPYAGYAVALLSPCYAPLSKPSEVPGHRVGTPSSPIWQSPLKPTSLQAHKYLHHPPSLTCLPLAVHLIILMKKFHTSCVRTYGGLMDDFCACRGPIHDIFRRCGFSLCGAFSWGYTCFVSSLVL